MGDFCSKKPIFLQIKIGIHHVFNRLVPHYSLFRKVWSSLVLRMNTSEKLRLKGVLIERQKTPKTNARR